MFLFSLFSDFSVRRGLARWSVLGWLLLLQACGTPPAGPVGKLPPAPAVQALPQASIAPVSAEAPPAPREFRAVWVSTVANIDWPSRRDLSSDKQKAEALAILENAAQMKLNAIVLQVRPSADAIYPSEIEPWSEYLTGEQGKAPAPLYDPLQFWIEQAHARGLELHAWFNPYRARNGNGNGKSAPAPNHISKSAPGVVRQYGDLLWMDPGEPAAMQQTLAVIADVLRRYDVDGIHIDDYFYPYPIKNGNGAELDFPDDASWIAYLQGGGTLSRADWRRDNVNRLVQAIYRQVRQQKNGVKFGISPFGIGRPDRLPPGIAGFSQYDKLYADVELWLERGWLDYLAPQLYWPLEQAPQAFRVLRDYWLAQNPQGRHIWPGLYTSRIDNSEKSWPPEEILNQVDAARENNGNGHLHFSMAALAQNRKQIRSRLSAEKYAGAALVPATPWLGKAPAQAPQLLASPQQVTVRLEQAEALRWLAIWKRYDKQWLFSVQAAARTAIELKNDAQYGALRQVVVSAIDRSGQESPRASYSLP